jgi:hypothetical protein
MSTRTTRKTVTFNYPFLLEGIDRTLPAGGYEVVTDEELIEELSFPVYRRVATTMLVPSQSYPGSFEMLTVDPRSLVVAKDRDAAATPNKASGLPAKVQRCGSHGSRKRRGPRT